MWFVVMYYCVCEIVCGIVCRECGCVGLSALPSVSNV